MTRYIRFLPAIVAGFAILVAVVGIPESPINLQAKGANDPGLNDLQVYLGYADVAPKFTSPNFPNPWDGSPNVIFVGNGVGTTLDYDSGAIRIDNPTSSNMTISSVTVELPGIQCNPAPYGCRPVHFDIWPRDMVIPAGYKLILTENSPRNSNMSNFDTSDRNFTNCSPSYWSPPDFHDPLITITTPSESQVIDDTGHILDRGGMDVAICIGNESAQWTLVWPVTKGAQNATSTAAALSNVTAID